MLLCMLFGSIKVIVSVNIYILSILQIVGCIRRQRISFGTLQPVGCIRRSGILVLGLWRLH